MQPLDIIFQRFFQNIDAAPQLTAVFSSLFKKIPKQVFQGMSLKIRCYMILQEAYFMQPFSLEQAQLCINKQKQEISYFIDPIIYCHIVDNIQNYIKACQQYSQPQKIIKCTLFSDKMFYQWGLHQRIQNLYILLELQKIRKIRDQRQRNHIFGIPQNTLFAQLSTKQIIKKMCDVIKHKQNQQYFQFIKKIQVKIEQLQLGQLSDSFAIFFCSFLIQLQNKNNKVSKQIEIAIKNFKYECLKQLDSLHQIDDDCKKIIHYQIVVNYLKYITHQFSEYQNTIKEFYVLYFPQLVLQFVQVNHQTDQKQNKMIGNIINCAIWKFYTNQLSPNYYILMPIPWIEFTKFTLDFQHRMQKLVKKMLDQKRLEKTAIKLTNSAILFDV